MKLQEEIKHKNLYPSSFFVTKAVKTALFSSQEKN